VAPAAPDDAPPGPEDLDPTKVKPEPTKGPTADNPLPELPVRGAKAEQWKVVNADRENLRKQVAKLTEDLKAIQNQTHPDFEKVKKELDEYKSLVREVAVERDPEIIGPILQRERDALEMVKAAVPAELQAEVLELLNKPVSDARDDALSKIMEGMNVIRQNRLDTARRELEWVQKERRSLSTRSQEAIQKRQDADKNRKAGFAREFQLEKADWLSEEKGLALLRPKAGDEAHNTRARDILESAEAIFNGAKLTPRQFSRAAFQAVTQPYLVEQNYALEQRNAELEAVITQLKGAGPPSVPAGNAGQTQVETPDEWNPDSGETLVQYQIRQMQKQGLLAGR
jgi:hypothetical protein